MNATKDASEFTGRLRDALALSGQTQADIAARLGVGASTVSMWLGGQRRPDRAAMEQLAQALDVTPMWLDYGSGAGPSEDQSVLRNRYREEIGWTFRAEEPDGSRDYGNANIFSFAPTIDSLVRETLQNIGDARASSGPVAATYTVRRLQGAAVDAFLKAAGGEGFVSHLKASIRSGQQVGSALAPGLIGLETRDLLLLEIADHGTTGLTGPEFNDGHFAALCRNNLDSEKSKAGAGGSYGLGKAVLWRMSSLSTVFFVSNLVQPAPDSGRSSLRFFGRTEMVWHELDDGRKFAGPGWYGGVDPEQPGRPFSYWDNSALANDLYMSRGADDAGTTILIVGFRDPSSDQEASPTQIAESIEAAVVKHFWPALAAKALSVKVQVAENDDILRSVDVNVREKAPELTSMLRRYEDGGLNDGLQEPGDVVSVDVQLAIPACKAEGAQHGAFKHNARVVIRRADPSQASDSTGRAQFFRGTRMVVSERNFSRILVGAQPFHAAVLCGTAAGNSLEDERAERFLRAAEPPAHTEWTMTEKINLEYARGSKVALSAFMDAVRDAVRDAMVPVVETPPDGPRELSALFNFGEPPRPERAPRLVVDSATVGPNGEWMVEGTIRVPKPTSSVAGRPTLVFDGESGTGTRASWLTLEAVKDCTVDGDVVRVAAGKRTARFRAVSNPDSHPIPTSQGAVSIDFRAVREDDRA